MQEIQLDHDEQIILTSRRHWMNLVPPVVSSAILLIAAVAVSYLSGRHMATLDGKLVPSVIVMSVITLLVILPVLLMSLAWWVYRRNQLILTNKHIFKLEQNGLFARRVSQLTLGQVEDVSGTRRGVIETLLNIGNVEVQTAGAQEEFIFIHMPDPARLAHAMSKARDEFGTLESQSAQAVSAAPAPAPQASPLQMPTVASTVGPTPEPAPVAEPPMSPPVAEESTTTADFGDHAESPAPAPEPPVEQPASSVPIAPPTSAELAENQTVQIPPPEPPAS